MSAPSAAGESAHVEPPRLSMNPSVLRRSAVDGGWWPRSAEVLAELPGLVLAVEYRVALIRVVLNPAEWADRPEQVTFAGRKIAIEWDADQPSTVLTGFGFRGARIDLTVIPSVTERKAALAAMEAASDPAAAHRAVGRRRPEARRAPTNGESAAPDGLGAPVAKRTLTTG